MELTEAQREALNQPFGSDALKIEQPPVVPTEESQPKEEPVEESEKPKEEEPSEAVAKEENSVPYSRFKKFHDRATEAAEEAAYWRRIAESSKSQPEEKSELPEYWKKMYGDSEASVEAWKVQQEANQDFIKNVREEAIRAVREEQEQARQQESQNLETIDSGLESLADTIGRQLTSKEESALLDIVDEYTPKDEDGNYLGSLMPFDKAWDIYEMKQQLAKAPKAQKRDAVAALTNSSGNQEPQKQDGQFTPGEWGSWRKKLPN